MGLPSHIPVFINPGELGKLDQHLISIGFYYTKLQVIYPGVIYARVLTTEFEGEEVDFHLRLYKSGKIDAEFEPRRLKDVVRHLTRKSYSGHEFVIQLLEAAIIEHRIDEALRMKYNENIPKEFKFQPLRFFHWLFYLCMIVSVIGLMWHTKERIKNWITNTSSISTASSK